MNSIVPEQNRELAHSIRDSYDALADEYSRRMSHELRHKPFDCNLLSRFATEIAKGRICDMGCGPGHVSRYLHTLGADVFGLDLSPKMLEKARSLYPEMEFREGNMLSLDLPDESLAGIVSFYSICNIPAESLQQVFREMHRVLFTGGLVLLVFHVGNETIHREEMWGKTVSLDFFMYGPKMIENFLKTTGFSIEESLEREPYPPEVEYQSRRAYIFARKSDRQNLSIPEKNSGDNRKPIFIKTP